MKGYINCKPEKNELDAILDMIEKQKIRGLAKAISIVENGRSGKEYLLDVACRRDSNTSTIIGFTGAPGTGKSTLINSIIREYRKNGKTVGVIAVDPTSPFSGGAVLGDRMRMQEHNSDSGVYIRSLASRKALGGLSEATKYILYLYKAFAFDVIIIETVGVGQDEIDVAKYVEVTSVLLVPGYGDTIQLAKAGIMEIADILVINKSDLQGADLLTSQVENSVNASREKGRPIIVNTIADKNEGVKQLIEAISKKRKRSVPMNKKKQRERITEEIRSSVIAQLDNEVGHYLDRLIGTVISQNITPFEAIEKVLSLVRSSHSN